MPGDVESLIDIQQAGKRIQKFSKGISYAELEVNEEKLSAILYQITIIGEATKRLSSELYEQYPEIPWRNLSGMRNVIVHEYDQVDLDVVWDVIQHKIPDLLESLEVIISEKE
jgi:uncharacterized protein with HEPN domain